MSSTCITGALEREGTVMVDDRTLGLGKDCTYLFADPDAVLVAHALEEVQPALEAIDSLLGRGRYVAGFIGYEAGLVLAGLPSAAVRGLKPYASPGGTLPPSAVRTETEPMTPLLWLGVYRQVLELPADRVDTGPWGEVNDLQDIQAAVTEQHYRAAVGRIREYIAAGDVYQVNFTYKLRFRNTGSARALFSRLRSAHPVPHAAYLNLGRSQIASLSPELFLRREGDLVLTRPMKGTAPRGRWMQEDADTVRELAADPKNRAENVMIVDLMRNDIGRVCRTGSVKVPELFHVGRYGSVLQMTSDVVGELREGLSTAVLMRAILPPGSVTGAPKRRAMERIYELESEARGPYCGAIGFFAPGNRAVLNVAIRTVVQQGDRCELGIGGGIVFDSRERSESQEARLKSAFLYSVPVEFVLRETLRFETAGEGSYPLLDYHLRRLSDSAAYFGRPCDKTHVLQALDAVVETIRAAARTPSGAAAGTAPGPPGHAAARVGLSLDRCGEATAEWAWLEAGTGPVRLLLGEERVDSRNIFQYHKTSRRDLYDQGVRAAVERGYFDKFYLNQRDEVAEGARTSIAARLNGRWATPPLSSGLLPGIWRQRLLESGDAVESVLRLDDLRKAERVVVGNAVRGTLEVSRIDAASAGHHATIYTACHDIAAEGPVPCSS